MTDREDANTLANLARVRELLQDADVDVLVASSPRNVYYLSGYFPFDSIIEPEKSVFAVIPSDHELPAQVTVTMSERYVLEDYPVHLPGTIFYGDYCIKNGPPVERVVGGASEALTLAIAGSGAPTNRIGVEFDLIPFRTYASIRTLWPKARLVDISPVLQRARQVKSAEEIRRITYATRATDNTLKSLSHHLEVGMTERRVAEWLAVELQRENVDTVYILVGAGRRSALGVSHPTERRIERGDIVRIDVAAAYGRYVTDLGRNYVVGSSPTDAQRTYYDLSRGALQTAVESVAVGVPVGDVFRAAMDVVRDFGDDSFHRHHVGHGIGLQAHEWPFVRPGFDVLESGAVLALEVPLYIYDCGGFSPEDIVVVRDEGIELLSTSPAHLPEVG
jgi:Xaa-Pro aminopeptidase